VFRNNFRLSDKLKFGKLRLSSLELDALWVSDQLLGDVDRAGKVFPPDAGSLVAAINLEEGGPEVDFKNSGTGFWIQLANLG
jgi:hypothetical protein